MMTDDPIERLIKMKEMQYLERQIKAMEMDWDQRIAVMRSAQAKGRRISTLRDHLS
jgi:hypothetical protein